MPNVSNDNQQAGSHFPMVVQYDNEEHQSLIRQPLELCSGKAFRVIETSSQEQTPILNRLLATTNVA